MRTLQSPHFCFLLDKPRYLVFQSFASYRQTSILALPSARQAIHIVLITDLQ